MLETISRIESAMLRDSYIKKLSRKLNVSESSIREDYRKEKPRKVSADRKERETVEPGERAQRQLLQYLLLDDKLINLILDEFDPADFSASLRPIAEKASSLYREGALPLSQTLPAAFREEAQQSLISRWLIESTSQSPDRKEIIDLLIYIRKQGLSARGRELEKQISHYAGEGREITHLQRKSRELNRELEQMAARLRKKFEV